MKRHLTTGLILALAAGTLAVADADSPKDSKPGGPAVASSASFTVEGGELCAGTGTSNSDSFQESFGTLGQSLPSGRLASASFVNDGGSASIWLEMETSGAHLKYLLGLSDDVPADVNGDGRIDIGDAIAIDNLASQ